MAPRARTSEAARSVRFGRLERASARADRARAEAAIRALPGGRRKIVWARGLAHGVELVAGRWATEPFTFRRDRDHAFVIGRGRRDAELGRIEAVAALDRAVLRAARHAATARLPRDKRLAFRTSIPGAVLISDLAVEALDPRNWLLDPDAVRFVSELAGAGVLAVWFLDDGRVVVVPRPDLSLRDGVLHALERPAVRWPKERLWFWQGMWIPESTAVRREELGPADVFAERNLERRRVIVDVLGFENLLRAATGGEPAQQDDYGRLWRLGPLLDDEDYVAVEIVNSTPEPDGSFRHYFLRVPPDTQTARAGVAWSFELTEHDYVLAAQS